MKKLQMLLCAFAAGAAIAELVEYRDYDANTGSFTNAVRECTLVTSATRVLYDGWYAVAAATTNKIENGVDISGTAHLILCDGALFEVGQPAENRPGIITEGATLAIYGQAGGSGTLKVKGGDVGVGEIEGSAGIGGRPGYAGGTVIINGGKVIATSESGGAAIGGGFEASGGTVTINGGTVTAVSKRYGAGIGGGSSVTGGNLVSGGTVTINGGTVTAIGGGAYASGIGAGGRNGIGAKLTINGGTVTARGDMGGADIGCATNVSKSVMTTITGGKVNASNIVDGVAISGGIFGKELEDGWLAPDCLKVENPDEATKADYPWAVIPPCTVTVGTLSHMTAVWTSGEGAVTNEIEGASFKVPDGTVNVKVIFAAKKGCGLVGEAVVDLGTVTADVTFGEESGYEVPGVRLLPVLYVDAAGEVQTKAGGDFDIVTEETRFLTNGWYAVLNDVAIPAGAHLTVQGDAHLILCDGASLTVADPGDHAAGIAVVDANRLTIYGQEAGTGVLTAQGGQFSAGIGSQTTGYGAYEPDCGTVTINGGTVVATGGESASGIGCSPMGLGGHVAIHGGTVAATGGLGGAGLGGNGNSGLAPKADSEVVITGGRVSATGNNVKDIHFANISISGGVFARRPDAGWCAEHFAVYANPDPETCADYPYAVQPSCTVTVGARTHMAVAWTSGDGTTTNSLAGMSFVVTNGTENVTVIFTAQADWEIVGDGVVKIGTVTDDIVFGTGDGYRVPEVRYLLGDIPYRDWNGTQMTNAALPKYVFTFVTDETRELDNGWYAVTNDVVFPAYESLAVKGNAHLVLCDGASLTIQSGYGNTAVDARGGSLTIYGQEKGTGALTAMGGSGVAGIGGTVTINGGTVTATGGMWGAGIGGGDGGAGGNVTINGGTVTAMGGASAAGIGGGQSGAGGRVTIRGGAVSATGGSGAEDVGRGAGLQDSGAVSVSGGIFARPVQNAWLADDHAVIANQDVMTVAAYPWAVVPYPAAWPAADDAVKAKFGAWRNGAGAEVDLSVDEAQKAFLLNVPVTGIKELKIESIEVDEEGYATIVVSAPGAFFFDRVDLGEINGVLHVVAGDALDTMEPRSVAHWTTTMGKAMIKVKENFIRAVLGFKTPDVAADTLQPEQSEAK